MILSYSLQPKAYSLAGIARCCHEKRFGGRAALIRDTMHLSTLKEKEFLHSIEAPASSPIESVPLS